jgi:hypothetical protein
VQEPVALPAPPVRAAFADQEGFEEAMGFWHSRICSLKDMAGVTRAAPKLAVDPSPVRIKPIDPHSSTAFCGKRQSSTWTTRRDLSPNEPCRQVATQQTLSLPVPLSRTSKEQA